MKMIRAARAPTAPSAPAKSSCLIGCVPHYMIVRRSVLNKARVYKHYFLLFFNIRNYFLFVLVYKQTENIPVTYKHETNRFVSLATKYSRNMSLTVRSSDLATIVLATFS